MVDRNANGKLQWLTLFAVLFLGPETPYNELLADRMKGVDWDATAIGWGLRGANSTALTEEFSDAVNLLKDKEPDSPIVFNHSPTSTLEVLKIHAPIKEDCAKAGIAGQDWVGRQEDLQCIMLRDADFCRASRYIVRCQKYVVSCRSSFRAAKAQDWRNSLIGALEIDIR